MDQLRTVFSRACSAANSGQYEAALKDFIWLHDHPDRNDLSSEVFRRANGFSVWALMGTHYPPAADKMRELLNIKVTHLKLHPDDQFVRADAGAMQQALAMYDLN